jgi:hypothetical protein
MNASAYRAFTGIGCPVYKLHFLGGGRSVMLIGRIDRRHGSVNKPTAMPAVRV